ncbi:MAG: ATP-binding protein [Candidatus Latescibacterota bacterium]
MRWIAVAAAALLVFLAVEVAHLLPARVRWPLFLCVTAIAGFNLFFTFLVRRAGATRGQLLLQVYVDLGMLTLLLHFSGGIENPLYLLAVFHVIIGGILLSRRQCYGVATLATGLFALLAWLEWSGLVEHYALLLFPHYREAPGSLHPALPHGEEGVRHAAHQTLYVASVMAMQFTLLFLTAHFATTLAEEARSKERQLERMADRALAERQLLTQALETTGTALRVLDPELRPRWINRQWKEWFAPGPPQPHQPGALADLPGTAEQTLQDGAVRVTECVLSAASESLYDPSAPRRGQRILQVTTAPLLDRNAQISQVVELAQDVTQQKRAQAQIMQAGKMAAIGELAGHVAHEVNNPIAILSAKARLVLSDRRSEMSATVAGELHKIVDLADRVAGIAHGLLSYCRPAPLARTSLDIRHSVRRALAIIEQRARAEGVKVEERLAPQLPPVRANANEMEQVFLNLFLNALDAMPAGGRLTVAAGSAQERLADGAPCVAVVVEDTGSGIPPEIRERIFEPFFTNKDEGRGTGLGLSICLRLVRSHGGEIHVESTPGQGSRFTVRLPLHTPEVLHG